MSTLQQESVTKLSENTYVVRVVLAEESLQYDSYNDLIRKVRSTLKTFKPELKFKKYVVRKQVSSRGTYPKVIDVTINTTMRKQK